LLQCTSGQVYADEYRFWGALQAFAIIRSIALILIHHDRKPNGNGGHVVDTVSGTRAITGAADHLWFLERTRATSASTLKVIGRDLEETSVQFIRSDDGRLLCVSAAGMNTFARADRRAEACRMRENGSSFGAIATALGISKSTASAWCSA